jgi:predicted nucleotide-binding protein
MDIQAELTRVKAEVDALPVGDEANRKRVRNAIEALIRASTLEKAQVDKFVKQIEDVWFTSMSLGGDSDSDDRAMWDEGKKITNGIVDSILYAIQLVGSAPKDIDTRRGADKTLDVHGEFQRIRTEIQALAVKDEAGRKRLVNELENVARAVLPKADVERYVKQIQHAGDSFYPAVFFGGTDRTPISWPQGQSETVAVIDSIEHQLRLTNSQAKLPEKPAKAKSATGSKKIFIVHGHDEAILNAVLAYVHRLELEPIVLKDQASQGKTIIEKIEHHSDVGFAIVLLSADDVGRSNKESAEADKPRARQNAVLELGYFMGLLGRRNVCVIVNADMNEQTEYPTDIAGVIRIPYRPSGDWQVQLLREFRGADLQFNQDRI